MEEGEREVKWSWEVGEMRVSMWEYLKAVRTILGKDVIVFDLETSPTLA